MAKTNKQINKEAEVSDNDSSPAVVAYRVAQLEINQEKRFDSLSQQLANIVQGFVTEKEMAEAKLEGEAEHKRLWEAVDSISRSARWWVGIILAAITSVGGILALVIK